MYIEIWKWIPGWEGYYMASTHGRIKSVDRYVNGKNGSKILKKGRIIKQSTDKAGYKYVCLKRDGKNYYYRVHRLVGMTFIPNPNNYPQINHKDENPANNHVSNLEFCTAKYNCNYGTHNEKISKANKDKGKVKGKAILMFTEEGEFIRRFDRISDALRYLGKTENSSSISKCARGRITNAYGYIWKYE